MFNRKLIATAALGLAVLNAAPVAAQTSVSVPIGHLNLTSEAGQQALASTIAGTTREICGTRPNIRELKEVRSYRSCVAEVQVSFKNASDAAIASANSADNMRMAMNDDASTEG